VSAIINLASIEEHQSSAGDDADKSDQQE